MTSVADRRDHLLHEEEDKHTETVTVRDIGLPAIVAVGASVAAAALDEIAPILAKRAERLC